MITRKTVVLLTSLSLLLIFSVWLASAESLYEPTPDRVTSVVDAIKRLKAGGANWESAAAAQRNWLTVTAATASSDKEKSEAWLKLTDEIYIAAASADTTSEVTFVSKPDGAQVQYQTEVQRKNNINPTTAAKETNNAREKLYIGYYFIWTVRDGKRTSDDNREYHIVEKHTEVELVE
jgi:hypothetical protein